MVRVVGVRIHVGVAHTYPSSLCIGSDPALTGSQKVLVVLEHRGVRRTGKESTRRRGR